MPESAKYTPGDYPTDDELETIRTWRGDDLDGLMSYLASGVWHWEDFVHQNEKGQWVAHTGGWSGNEDIIEAMRDNTIWWMMNWQATSRGGHYVFETSHHAAERILAPTTVSGPDASQDREGGVQGSLTMPESTGSQSAKYTPTTLTQLANDYTWGGLAPKHLAHGAHLHAQAWEAQLAAARRLAEAVGGVEESWRVAGDGVVVTETDAEANLIAALAAWRQANGG